jgi:2-oxoglutaroyl-CoA hydrolase
MWKALREGFTALRDEREVRAVFIRSACETAFCAGLDLGGSGMSPGGLRETIREYHATFDAMEDHPTPVVAVLHGHTLGGGMEMAMACDIRLAAEDTVMGLTEARVGLIPADGGTQRLAKYVGLGRAKYMILTGDKIDAQKAYAWGLIDELVPREGLAKAVQSLGERLVRCAPLSQLHCKKLIRKSFEMTRDQGEDGEADAVMALAQSRDLIEGMTAFMQKRPPQWKGK